MTSCSAGILTGATCSLTVNNDITEFTGTLGQTVVYNIPVSQYSGVTKEAYDLGYASFLGIFDAATNALKIGVTLSESASSYSPQSVAVTYSASIPGNLVSATVLLSASSKDSLVAAIDSIIQSRYSSASIPPAVISAIQPAGVTIDPIHAWLQQSIVFSGAVRYNSDLATRTAYNKGVAKYFGVYKDGHYTAGHSMVGVETAGAARRSSTSITFLAVLSCSTLNSAMTTAGKQNGSALRDAIQSVINEPEYSSVGTAAAVASMGEAHAIHSCDTQADSGWSGAMIAGIVVGSILGIVIFAGVGYMLCKKSILEDKSVDKGIENYEINVPATSPRYTPELYPESCLTPKGLQPHPEDKLDDDTAAAVIRGTIQFDNPANLRKEDEDLDLRIGKDEEAGRSRSSTIEFMEMQDLYIQDIQDPIVQL
jgi:hypothetical protein